MSDDYISPKARARVRVRIDEMLGAAGWVVQDCRHIDRDARRGVAVRGFPLAGGHGRADHLLFMDGEAVGVLEAKRAGMSLTGVEAQSAKYVAGPPESISAVPGR